MVQLINKGGFRERANRSRRYQQSENHQTTLKPNTYTDPQADQTTEQPCSASLNLQDQNQTDHSTVQE